MTLASRVSVARHGERIDHVDRSWSDTAENPHDPFLTEKGIRQARALGENLAETGLTHIFASPFYRTVQTAHEVAKITGVVVKIESGLSEWLNPDWFSEEPKLQPVANLMEDFALIDATHCSVNRPKYPETRDALVERAGKTAQLLAEKFSGHILFIAHGITCEFTVRGITGTGPRPYISYCSLQTCNRGDDATDNYFIEGPNEPDISFMPGDIKPYVKTGYQ